MRAVLSSPNVSAVRIRQRVYPVGDLIALAAALPKLWVHREKK
jgi:hypothetical protein